MSGYALWHPRLGHCPMPTIRDTIPHAKGIEELNKVSFDPNQRSSVCMVGKAHLEIRPNSLEHAQLPLERGYMETMSSSVPSIQGYNYALIIADDVSMYQRVCGLKEKSDANAAAEKWICNIGGLKARYEWQKLIRGQAGELKRADLKAYILNHLGTSWGVGIFFGGL